MKLRSEPVEVDLVLQEAALRGLVTGPRDITVEAAPSLFARADPDRLLQVITNLVMNALAHAGPDAAVRLVGRRSENRVEIEVTDTGKGIPPQDIDRIFDRLYRGSMPKTDTPGGAGLGLAIVSSLTEAMGGEVRVTSTLGVGTTFTIALPVAEERPAPRHASKETGGTVVPRS